MPVYADFTWTSGAKMQIFHCCISRARATFKTLLERAVTELLIQACEAQLCLQKLVNKKMADFCSQLFEASDTYMELHSAFGMIKIGSMILLPKGTDCWLLQAQGNETWRRKMKHTIACSGWHAFLFFREMRCNSLCPRLKRTASCH